MQGHLVICWCRLNSATMCTESWLLEHEVDMVLFATSPMSFGLTRSGPTILSSLPVLASQTAEYRYVCQHAFSPPPCVHCQHCRRCLAHTDCQRSLDCLASSRRTCALHLRPAPENKTCNTSNEDLQVASDDTWSTSSNTSRDFT